AERRDRDGGKRGTGPADGCGHRRGNRGPPDPRSRSPGVRLSEGDGPRTGTPWHPLRAAGEGPDRVQRGRDRRRPENGCRRGRPGGTGTQVGRAAGPDPRGAVAHLPPPQPHPRRAPDQLQRPRSEGRHPETGSLTLLSAFSVFVFLCVLCVSVVNPAFFFKRPMLTDIILSTEPAVRNRPLAAACDRLSYAELLAERDALDRFRRDSANLYDRVRALFFLYAIDRFHLPARA